MAKAKFLREKEEFAKKTPTESCYIKSGADKNLPSFRSMIEEIVGI